MTLTPEARALAVRWLEKNGKSPENVGYGFAWNDLEAEPDGLPWQLYVAESTGMVYSTEEECIDAFAVAFTELRDVLGVDAEVRAATEVMADALILADGESYSEGNFPGHGHRKKNTWDRGGFCGQCITWNKGLDAARAIRKEPT